MTSRSRHHLPRPQNFSDFDDVSRDVHSKKFMINSLSRSIDPLSREKSPVIGFAFPPKILQSQCIAVSPNDIHRTEGGGFDTNLLPIVGTV